MDKTLTRTISQIALIVLFFIVIGTPPLFYILLPDKEWSNAENRLLTSFPGLPSDWKTFLQFQKNFETYYNDHFGFREVLIDRYHREMKKRFGQPGVPSIVAGKEGWYFWIGNNLLDDFRGRLPLTEPQLRSWKEDFGRKRDWLAKQGIRYLFVSVPDKQTVYPEYLPDHLQKAKGTTRLEQLTEYLKQDPPGEILDLRSSLLNAKSEMRLYQKTDTHWNDYGAFVAYREIVHKISPWFPKEQFKLDFCFQESMGEGPAGDLTRILGLNETLKEMFPLLKERHFCARPIELTLAVENVRKSKESEPFMRGCPDSRLRALVFRDSFFGRIEPFFSENFRQVVYLWQPYDQKTAKLLIDYLHPDLVIEEGIERFFFRNFTD